MSSRQCSAQSAILVGILLVALNLARAQTPSPALLVVVKDANALAIVNPTDGKIVATVTTGEGPHEVTTDGKLAYVSNHGGDTAGSSISVIDLAARKELRRVEVGAMSKPHGVLFSGGKVYFTAEGYKLVGRYDPQSNQIDWLVGTGQDRTHMLVLSKDRNRIFTANMASDTITAIEGVSAGPPNWTITAVSVGKTPEALDISPDGKEVWTLAWRDGILSIIDAETKKVVQTINPQIKHANRLKFTPDGKRVLISDIVTGELVIMEAMSRREIKRMKVGNRASGILVVPDSSRAYVSLSGDGQVATIDLKTLEVTGRIMTGPSPDGLAWAENR